MSVIHAPEETPLDARQLFLPAVLVLTFGAFFLRLWSLQVTHHDEYKKLAKQAGQISVSRLAPRGLIVDRFGNEVAGVSPEVVVRVVANVALEHPDSIARAAEILGMTPEELEEQIREVEKPDLATPIYLGATMRQATQIAEGRHELVGFDTDLQPMRAITRPLGMAHLLGHVWKPTAEIEEELKEKGVERSAAYVGRNALERQYEPQLMGVAGAERMVVDARMRPVRSLGVDFPQPGSRMTLTIDYHLQELGQKLLNATPSGRGALVAIDPRTGEVLALVSAPDFDLGMYEGGISKLNYQKLSNDPSKPLFNRAIAGAYSPGSTFKIINALAGFENGVVTGNRAIYCPGYKMVGNRRVACGNHSAGLTMSFHDALKKSCNTYFITLALEMGHEKLEHAAHEAGIGEITHLDIPGERSGLLPDEAWKKKQNEPWYPGDTANMAIGQGALSATPLQMAQMISMVANQGTAYRPHLVRSFETFKEAGVEKQQVEPEVSGRLEASPAFWGALKSALIDVIESGTARSAQIKGVKWAGKTGSTEHARAKETHAWFVGYAPADNPEIAIAVLVEAAGHGGTIAAPIAKEVVQAWLERDKRQSPSSVRDSAASRAADAPPSSPASP